MIWPLCVSHDTRLRKSKYPCGDELCQYINKKYDVVLLDRSDTTDYVVCYICGKFSQYNRTNKSRILIADTMNDHKCKGCGGCATKDCAVNTCLAYPLCKNITLIDNNKNCYLCKDNSVVINWGKNEIPNHESALCCSCNSRSCN